MLNEFTAKLKFKYNSIKQLSFGLKKHGGRNNSGHITTYHRGGGCKNKIRIIDYKKMIWNVPGFIHRIEYDPNRSSLIALIVYSNGIMCYSIHVSNLRIGDVIFSTLNNKFLKKGVTTFLKNIPFGTKIHCIESYGNRGAQFVRSAGTYAVIISKGSHNAIVKLPSNELRKFHLNSIATVGVVSNFQTCYYRKFKKASYYRLKGWRPVVRGVAMNPVDHPHGGGQGKTSGGRPSVTPYGFITKGKPTVKVKSKYVILNKKN